LKNLENIRGRHTELISLYIPSGFNLQEIMSMLKKEYALTQNVKSRVTRHNVLNALEKTMNHLRLFKKTPPNGLVIFCGNVSKKEGQPEIKIWSIEPPQPLAQKIYWCDQNFVLDPLKDMTREKEIYVAKSIFTQEKDLKGVIIGGPGPIKERFKEGDYLDYRIKEKILGIVDTSYTGDQGLQELIQRGESLIQEATAVRERKMMEEFFGHLQKDDGLSVYGLDEVKHAIDFGAVKTLLISEEYDWIEAKLSCQCGYKTEEKMKPGTIKKCPKCKSEMKVDEEIDLIDLLSDKARDLGSEVEIISVDTREGAQFKELGGIGAILRFKIG